MQMMLSMVDIHSSSSSTLVSILDGNQGRIQKFLTNAEAVN